MELTFIANFRILSLEESDEAQQVVKKVKEVTIDKKRIIMK